MPEVKIKFDNNLYMDYVSITSWGPVACIQFVSNELNIIQLINLYYDLKKELSEKYQDIDKNAFKTNNASFKLDKIGTHVSLQKFEYDRYASGGKVFIFFGGDIDRLIHFLIILEKFKLINEINNLEIIKAYKQASYEVSLKYENSSLVGLCVNTLIKNIDFNKFVEKTSDEYFYPIVEHYRNYKNYCFWKEKDKVKELLELKSKMNNESKSNSML